MSRFCRSCLDRLRRDLHGLLELDEEYEQMLTAGPGGFRERVSGSRGLGIALDGEIVALRSELCRVITSWVRVIIVQGRVAPPSRSDARGLVHFLDLHFARLALHPAVIDLECQVIRLLDVGSRIVRADLERRVRLGHCVQPGCAQPLYAVLRSAGATEGPPSRVWCESGHVFPPTQWLLVADQLRRNRPRRDVGARRAA